MSASASAQIVAQPSAGTNPRAVAASYKSALYCSDLFNAGRTPAQIDADELTGIYSDYDKIVATLTLPVHCRRLRSRATAAIAADLPLMFARFLYADCSYAQSWPVWLAGRREKAVVSFVGTRDRLGHAILCGLGTEQSYADRGGTRHQA